MPIIGVVGGIGSGKSSLARALEGLGCRRIDADALGHKALEQPAVVAELVATFGEEIAGDDGCIRRPELARRAFADEASTSELNRIVGTVLWPEFRRRALGAADHADAETPAVVLDAALLYESENEDLCDCVVFVDAPDDVRRRRIRDTRGWDWKEVERREARQFPLSRKRELADVVINNDSDTDRLAEAARDLLDDVRRRFDSTEHNGEDRIAPRGAADRSRKD